jgi:hypothetical protein
MGQQQGQPQEQAQQQPQQQQGKGPFPASQEEALQFSNDILQILYDERTHGNIIKQLSIASETEKVHAVGMVAANTVGERVADVKAQTGRPIEMELAVGAVESVVKELTTMAKGNGFFELSKEEEQAAIKTSIEMLDGIEGSAK